MSRSIRTALFALALLAGCYSPKLGTPGFFCHPDDDPACPDGQECVDNRCVSLDMKGRTTDGGVLLNGNCSVTGKDCAHDSDCCGGFCDLTMKKCL
jgi:hypothetical protein